MNMLWLYIDYAGRVLGANTNDMRGTTGWEEAEVPEGFNIDILYDNHGAPLYKLIDGQLITRSEEERKSDWPEPEPTPVDPITRLRADVDYIAMMTEVDL